jgi:hypothetical protein
MKPYLFIGAMLYIAFFYFVVFRVAHALYGA